MIYKIVPSLSWRSEFYWMQNIEDIVDPLLAGQTTLPFVLDFKHATLAATSGLVYELPFGSIPVGLFVNYYQGTNTSVRVLIHVGYMIFNRGAWD